MAVHSLLFALAFFCAFGLRYNFESFHEWFRPFFVPLVGVVVAIKMVMFGRMGLYYGFWRYVGIRDAVHVTMATTWSTCIFIALFFTEENLSHYLYGPQRMLFLGFPQSVFILDWGCTIVMACGARAAVRLYHEESRLEAHGGATRCLILGAGDTGETLLREILRMPEERYRVVGFLDDAPSKRNIRIHDVPVLGVLDDVREIAEAYDVTEALMAMPSAPKKRVRRVVEAVQGTNIRLRIVPGMADLIGGHVTVSQIRDVDINDLLGREPVSLDDAAIAAFIESKTVLVTGAGGSIGSELCRQIVRFNPKRVVLLEQAENNLFLIDRELAEKAPRTDRVCYIADICDEARIRRVFDGERPHAVFHAAAHKHVPMMESNVGEAIKNNVSGTLTVAAAAERVGVARFVMISTDKAVNPTSVMGCTKRVAELGLQHLGRRSKTQFITVRFGNVLGSSGSVVPVFREQIARGGPVTVTHPEMTRYFMTIPEATQLVLQAGAMGHGGEIFVLDMGEPVKIVDLARQMITLSGFRPGEDIEIVFTGKRPGEKLYEELSVSGEDMSPTRHEKIYVWRQRAEDWDRIAREIEALVRAADELPSADLKARLAQLVREYQPEPEPPAALPPAGTARAAADAGLSGAVAAAHPRGV